MISVNYDEPEGKQHRSFKAYGVSAITWPALPVQIKDWD
jgi:hypothetical protein